MISGRSSPFYGQLMTASLPSEVKKLWYSRDEELEPLPSWRWSFEMQADMEQLEQRDMLVKILQNTPLTEREELAIRMVVVEEATLDEVGQELNVTKERARQIFLRGIRRLRTHQIKVTRVAVWSLDCEVMTWNRYSWMQRQERARARQ